MKGVWYELIVWVSWGHRGGDGGGNGGSGGGYSQNAGILVALVDTDVYCNGVCDVMMLSTTRHQSSNITLQASTCMSSVQTSDREVVVAKTMEGLFIYR